LTEEEVGKLNEELSRWVHRTDVLEDKMKKRFPNGE
jgi:hypothetical protein